jgi:hypothetical protein
MRQLWLTLSGGALLRLVRVEAGGRVPVRLLNQNVAARAQAIHELQLHFAGTGGPPADG